MKPLDTTFSLGSMGFGEVIFCPIIGFQCWQILTSFPGFRCHDEWIFYAKWVKAITFPEQEWNWILWKISFCMFARKIILEVLGCAWFKQVFEMSCAFFRVKYMGRQRGKFQNSVKLVNIYVLLLFRGYGFVRFLQDFQISRAFLLPIHFGEKRGKFKRPV